MYFITEQLKGEPCVLKGNTMKTLYIRSLSGEILKEFNPTSPWTHESLINLDLENIPGIEYGADAYLGNEWIGSTEC